MPRPRTLITTGALLVCASTALGGPLLAMTEQDRLVDGWLTAFSVVSTVGFGDGPATAPGLAVIVGVFAVAAVGYFLLLTAAFELAMQRIENDRLRRLRMRWTEKDALRLLDELSRN